MLLFECILWLMEFLEFLGTPFGLSMSLWASAYWILLQLSHATLPLALCLPLMPALCLYAYLEELEYR